MSDGDTQMNIDRLMTTFNFEIEALPDKLKCAKCKSLLNDAYQMPCGCRLCRACIDDVNANVGQFCPGGSQECATTPLSSAVPDYNANRHISKLTTKCPHAGCSHECPLADIENHVRVCSRKIVDCPFRELGCAQGTLAAEEMGAHLLQESGSHSEILVGMVANINSNVEMLKRELLLKNEQIKHNKNEIESLKREKEILSDRVRQLAKKLEREVDQRRQNDERDSARISAVTGAVASNRNAMGTEVEPIRDEMRSIKSDIDSMKRQMESIQVVVGLGQLGDWLIDVDVGKTHWDWGHRTSEKFRGVTRPYTYELASENSISGGELFVWLRIHAGSTDSALEWPFRGVVTFTVSHRDRRETCSRQTRQCRIERPKDNDYSISEAFVFPHAALRRAGLDLERGVLVSCQIVPGVASDAVSPRGSMSAPLRPARADLIS